MALHGSPVLHSSPVHHLLVSAHTVTDRIQILWLLRIWGFDGMLCPVSDLNEFCVWFYSLVTLKKKCQFY